MTNSSFLTKERCRNAVKIAVVATFSLYALLAFVAEPAMSLAATDTETVIVSVTVAGGIGLNCDANGDGIRGSGETLSLGTITFTGDTFTGSSVNAKKARCRVLSNSANGYTLGWHIASASNNGLGTGHLTTSSNDIIAAFGTGHTFTKRFDTNVTTSDSRWAGRVVPSMSNGTTYANNMDFGTDGADTTEKWARIATGSTYPIWKSTTVSASGSGDTIAIAFRARVGANKVQPTGTYTATVTFTATNL